VPALSRKLVAEAIGTAILLAAVVGSGIMAERLAEGNVAIALLANFVAIGGALVCLILALGSISGAHFNPAGSIADAMRGGLSAAECAYYIVAQMLGAITGTLLFNWLAPVNALQGLDVVLPHDGETRVA